MASLLSTDGLKATCLATESNPTDILVAVTSPAFTMQGFPVILEGTTVGGGAIVATNSSITVGGVAVLTTDDTYSSHVTTTIPPVSHPAGGSLTSNATGSEV